MKVVLLLGFTEPVDFGRKFQDDALEWDVSKQINPGIYEILDVAGETENLMFRLNKHMEELRKKNQ